MIATAMVVMIARPRDGAQQNAAGVVHFILLYCTDGRVSKRESIINIHTYVLCAEKPVVGKQNAIGAKF